MLRYAVERLDPLVQRKFLARNRRGADPRSE
jgi:hypothetical protein